MQKKLDKVWPGYIVDKCIGEGSYGRVYRIHKEKSSSFCVREALKVITIPRDRSELIARMNYQKERDLTEKVFDETYISKDEKSITTYFRNIVDDVIKEVEVMYALSGNTNVVNYIEHEIVPHTDEIGWDILIRMELLTPLYVHYEANPPKIEDIIQLGIDMCHALEVCQQYNIVHRDIKPTNIFVSKLGKYKLGDFGIARELSKTNYATAKRGTYLYMAPEVYKGETYNSTVDLYSLGLVLYQFFNRGRLPFMPVDTEYLLHSDEEKSVAMRMKGAEITKPCDADESISSVILKACAYASSDRYQNPKSMRKDLEKLLENSDPTPTSAVICGTQKLKGRKMAEGECVVELIENGDVIDTAVNNIEGEFRFNKIDYNEAGTYKYTVIEKKTHVEDIVIDKTRYDVIVEVMDVGGSLVADKKILKDGEEKELVFHNTYEPKKETKKIVPMIIGAVIVLLVIGGIVMRSLKYVKVPDVVGVELAKAENVLKSEDCGLYLGVVNEQYSDIVKEGCIISQTLQAGEKVEKGTRIDLVVSLGEELYEVPEVTGKTAEKAEELLKDSQISVSVIKKYSDKVEKGDVISQSITAGEMVKSGTKIEIVVSRGEKLYKVPDVEGKSLEEAKKLISDANLKCSTETTFHDTVPKGDVISQDIEAGEKVKKGTKIEIKVSDGRRKSSIKRDPDSQKYNPELVM